MSGLSRMRRPTSLRLPRLRLRAHPRLLGALVALALLLGGGWLWLRDSPLVAVQKVTVTGVSGPDARAIRAALVARAHTMTTLDVSTQGLLAAVAPYPVVKGLQVSTDFPHGMRIVVHEELPVGAVMVNGREIPVGSDGTILRDATSPSGLPLIALSAPPGGNAITDPRGVAAVALLAAAPSPVLARITSVDDIPARGLVAILRQGPELVFGDQDRLAAKWAAALAVLADGGSAGAAYIDVSDPGRPAAGGGPKATAAVNAALAAPATTASSPAAPAGTASSPAAPGPAGASASASPAVTTSAAAATASGSSSTGGSTTGSASTSGPATGSSPSAGSAGGGNPTGSSGAPASGTSGSAGSGGGG